MAIKPGIPSSPATRFNETAMAIAGSLVIGLVLATILTGNPFRAMRLAYTDYGAPVAVKAPAPKG